MAKYYDEWYEKNKEKRNLERREKYARDVVYRQACKDHAKSYRERKPSGDIKTTRARKPVLVEEGGSLRRCWTLAHLANKVERSPATLRSWIRKGLLPETPLRTSTKDVRCKARLYTDGQIQVIKTALQKRGRLKTGDMSFRKEVEEGWSALGICF
tara:strand:+ start:781 stop:1248 length:468 start_codon:yes stop_codon:yes gene_type:complete